MPDLPILVARQLSKSFVQPDNTRLMVLDQLELEVQAGRVIAITGASGSGKSTLLHLLGSLDEPDGGQVLFDGEDLLKYSGKSRAEYRNQNMGFVFQFHYLLPELTVIENIACPCLLHHFDRQQAFSQAQELLDAVGLADKRQVYPSQLSGGERQRVAIARSLVNHPRLLLADEPTGNLDWQTGEMIFDLFDKLVRDRNLTAIIVTHNQDLSRRADKLYHLSHGRLS